ncbi:DUF3800 domain-containing protein [Planktothrix paucivesiculata]|uniref:Uncharacterized protein n=1 Tax=Planktothrix paucivesiculata PCC 9631 TaxID=671071 RepID=A0A7Z9BL74_9CYAN|nr:DUF3800 domain-containing protein [Planktothrix paucivesiculata]VXD12938.1 conserved hypothetical protein [Planktothrix paucivesiculata PCC 9631]
MINFEISDIRKMTKMLTPTADFDSSFTFYYDETNNIRKFYVREIDFNSSFNSNFVLGGLVHEGIQPNIKSLFDRLNLQNNIKEVKLKHIATGNFLDCLKSEKLNYFLTWLLDSDLYIHYSSLNILYWSIVDIVDSAIANSEIAMQLELNFLNHLKNDLYKLAKLEIESVIELFYNFEYPNLKKEAVLEFIEKLTIIFDEYIDTEEFHFGLEYLRQILKEAGKKDSLPFVMDEENYILIEEFSQFYLRPIYLFENSNHIFDNEVAISEILANHRIIDDNKEIKNYSFVDSKSNLFVQASDVFIGLIGKLANYINTNLREEIIDDLDSLSEKQLNNIDLLIDLINKSHSKNIAFLHSIDSYEELTKMNLIREIRDKNHT